VGTQEQRSAQNQTIFRAGNEALRRSADGAAGRLSFICECGHDRCFERMHLAVEDYEAVRADPRRFVVVPGHERSGEERSRLVERGDGYSVIEKLDGAGAIAERLDPRAEERR
jgi:hypothetical protein